MRRAVTVCGVVLGLLQVSASAQQPSPVRILVTYYSQTGNTEKLAQAIGDGAKTVQGVEVTLALTRERQASGDATKCS